MFDRRVFEIATKHRITTGHLVGEVVVTAGLIAVIFALARTGRAALSAAAVGAYIGAAYWFTSSVFVGPRGSEKDQAELAYLDFVAVGQDCRLHRLTVDIGAVEAADVDDLEFAVLAPELGVPAADGDVIAEDIAVGVSAGGRNRLIQHEPRSRVRAALDHKQCWPAR